MRNDILALALAADEVVPWTDKRLAEVKVLELQRNAGLDMLEVKNCFGVLRDGTPVEVELPFQSLPRNWKASIIEQATKAGIFAKGLGLFDAVDIN